MIKTFFFITIWIKYLANWSLFKPVIAISKIINLLVFLVVVTAKGDFLGQRDLLNTQYPLIIKNRVESRFKLQNIKRKTKDLQHCTETTKK